jgi:hypothetical protein
MFMMLTTHSPGHSHDRAQNLRLLKVAGHGHSDKRHRDTAPPLDQLRFKLQLALEPMSVGARHFPQIAGVLLPAPKTSRGALYSIIVC